MWHATLRMTAKHTATIEFQVTTQADKAIVGGEACTELGLVKRIEALTTMPTQTSKPPTTKKELIEKYGDVFIGLGEFPGVHHIHVDPSVSPVIHGCRNIPIMYSLKNTLQDLEKREVIKPVNEPTDWVTVLLP